MKALNAELHKTNKPEIVSRGYFNNAHQIPELMTKFINIKMSSVDCNSPFYLKANNF